MTVRFLIAFAIYAVVEFLLADWLATWFGWPAVLALFVIGFVVGLLVMRAAGAKAAAALTQAARSGDLAADQIGDSGLLLAGGVLFAIPGVLTDLIAVLLVIPATRRGCRRPVAAFLGRGLRDAGVAVSSTRIDGDGGLGRSQGSSGDVIVGDVIERHDEPRRSDD